MYLRYSSNVVAPIQCNVPRARAGLSILEASTAPSAAPAPTTVWISSIKSTIFPSAFSTSFNTAFRRSSNSPRNFAPARSEPISSSTISLCFRFSGTSRSTTLRARPSTIAVFPVPGSPIRTGLFLRRLERVWIVRRISSSRPITGSNFPKRAN